MEGNGSSKRKKNASTILVTKRHESDSVIFSYVKSLHIHKRSPKGSSEKQQTCRPWGHQLGQQSFSCEASRVPTSIKNKYNKELLKRTMHDWRTSVFAQLLSCFPSPDVTVTVTAGCLHPYNKISQPPSCNSPVILLTARTTEK